MAHKGTAIAIGMIVAAGVLTNLLSRATAEGPSLPIHAKGRWSSSASGSGSWKADLAMHRNALSGIIVVNGKSDLGRAEVGGSADGNDIQFTVTANGHDVALLRYR